MPRPLLPEAMRTLPLTPVDGFVLSRVDGTSSEHEIAMATGLAEVDVHDSINKLAKLGVVSVPVDPSDEKKIEAPNPLPLESIPNIALSTGKIKISTIVDPAADEVVELEAANRQLVTELFAKLEKATHYDLLGVPPESDKKAIKRAYFELAAHVHPDRFFRKSLGSYKPKMEAIFARITLAHDVLTSKDRRPEYDAYLGARAKARRIESLSDMQAVRLPVSSPVAPPTSSQPAPAAKMLDERGRRELLARRLGRSSRAPAGPVSNAPTSQPKLSDAPPERSSDPDALKRLFEERLTQARTMQARKHMEAGDSALADDDVVSAATSYKTALSFLPDDPEISKKLGDVTERATQALADAYRKQATYEEKNGQWVEASRSWTRVAKILVGDSDVQDSAAKAIVQGGGDLHEAATFAQRAANANPESARFRKTLGSVYLAAGLKKNARRELEAAARISPDDDTILDLLKRAT
ncbi:MAG: DnaJ domain-containing protein [Polyangiaceae bacterium]